MPPASERFRAAWGALFLAFLVGGSLGAYLISLTVRPDPAPTSSPRVRPAAAAEKPRTTDAPPATKKVDPRRGGLEIGLGEWAVTPEADVIRPGKVTFVIHNRGTVAHGFEIELEGESSGSDSGSLFKAESGLLQPGRSTRMTLKLRPALYKIECLVDGHDDMGMEGTLEVRRDAPRIEVEPVIEPGSVTIENFAFSPDTIEVGAGTVVAWHNQDPAEHTVTALEGEFGSGSLDSGEVFRHTFDAAGLFRYRCAIHPDMRGVVKVR